MNATKTNTTKHDDNAWRTYRKTADQVRHLIAVLEGRLADHRIHARADQDEWLYDAELRRVAQQLEQVIDTLGE